MAGYKPPREAITSPDPNRLRVVPVVSLDEQTADWLKALGTERLNSNPKTAEAPDWVPHRIRILNDLCSDVVLVGAGDYDCRSTFIGLIIVTALDGMDLLVLPHECEVLAFRVNLKKLMQECRDQTDAEAISNEI